MTTNGNGYDWMTPVMTSGQELFNTVSAEKLNFFPFKEFKIPVYFFAGKYDYATSSEVVNEYFNTIKAPEKKLFWFEHSGHSPNWEEPKLYYQRVMEVAANSKIK